MDSRTSSTTLRGLGAPVGFWRDGGAAAGWAEKSARNSGGSRRRVPHVGSALLPIGEEELPVRVLGDEDVRAVGPAAVRGPRAEQTAAALNRSTAPRAPGRGRRARQRGPAYGERA